MALLRLDGGVDRRGQVLATNRSGDFPRRMRQPGQRGLTDDLRRESARHLLSEVGRSGFYSRPGGRTADGTGGKGVNGSRFFLVHRY